MDLSAEDGVDGQGSSSTPRGGKRKLPFEDHPTGSGATVQHIRMRLDKDGKNLEIENNSDKVQ